MITNLSLNNNLIHLRRSLACIYIQIRICLSDKQFFDYSNSSKDICDILKKMFFNKKEEDLNNDEINLLGLISDYIVKAQYKRVKNVQLDTPSDIILWFSSFLRSKYPKEIANKI